MRRFLLSTTIFLAFTICAYVIIAFLVYNYSDIFLKTERKEYVAKYLYFKEHKDDYNTLFIGSSKVYRQVDVELFDSIVDTKSFNFGVNGLTPPANIKLLAKLLELQPAKLKTVILELEFLRTIREYYKVEEIFYNFDPLIDLETILYREPEFNWKNICRVFAANFLKYTHFIQACLSKPKPLNELYIGRNGYVPLDLELQLSRDKIRRKHMQARRSVLKAGAIASFANLNKTMIRRIVKKSPGIYEALLDRVLEQCQQQNIKVIFLITPRSPINHIYAHHWHFLEKDNHKIININTVTRYPELYLLENSFDRNHLNFQGAEIFTRILAQEYIKAI